MGQPHSLVGVENVNKKLFNTLLFNNIRTKPTIYAFIIIGIIISNTLFMVFGDLYFHNRSELVEQQFITNRITFVFNSKPDYLSLDSEINKSDIDDIIYSCLRQNENGMTRVVAYSSGDNLYKSRFMSGGIDEEINTGTFVCSLEYVMMLENEQGIKLKTGTKINVDDIVLECVGIYLSDDFDILINKNDLFKIEDAVKFTYSYVLNEKTNITVIESLNQYIKDKFNPVFITYPEETRTFTMWGLLSELGPNLLLVLIAMINVLFIYSFLVRKRFYAYSILKLCGLTAKKTTMFLLCESEILFLISFVLSMPIYLLLSPLISGYDIVYSTLFYQFVYSFVILQIFNIIIFYLSTIKISKKNPIELLRESVVE